MLVDSIAGAFLVAGSAACAGAVIARRPVPGARAVLAVALAAAGAAALAGEAEPGAVAGCALATIAAAVLVLVRCGPVSRLSWLDAAMGAAATAALAMALGTDATVAVGIGGVAAGLGLSRWRPGSTVALVLVGLAALAAGPWGALPAAVLVGLAAWLPERPAEPAPEFSPVVLAALLAYASIALRCSASGIHHIEPVAIALAIVHGAGRHGARGPDRDRAPPRLGGAGDADDLTGLGNRRHLVDTLHAAIDSSGANGGELALLLIDLDGFKELNDTLGHHAGDEVLRQIGPRLKELLREDDTLARLGGDEFAVVLQPGDEATASTAGLRLRAALEELVRGRRHPRPHRRQRRDRALPEPRGGRDGAAAARRRRHVPGQAHAHRPRGLPRRRDRHSRQRLALVGELGAALEAGEPVLHYQPKAELRSGQVRGVEALVRWEHPKRGLLGPTHFLPLVEQSGLTPAR